MPCAKDLDRRKARITMRRNPWTRTKAGRCNSDCRNKGEVKQIERLRSYVLDGLNNAEGKWPGDRWSVNLWLFQHTPRDCERQRALSAMLAAEWKQLLFGTSTAVVPSRIH